MINKKYHPHDKQQMSLIGKVKSLQLFIEIY
jgi:hypothetical protein